MNKYPVAAEPPPAATGHPTDQNINMKTFRNLLLGIVALCVCVACNNDSSADVATAPIPKAKDPAAIKALAELKALPDSEARRAFLTTHPTEATTLHNDPGAWKEASDLAYADMRGKANQLDRAVQKNGTK